MSDHVANVLVVGDVILDRYFYGRKKGLSAETPTIVGYLEKEELFVGGAGLVVRNLLRLGSMVTLLTTGGPNSSERLYNSFKHFEDPLTEGECTRFNMNVRAMPGWRISEKHRMYVDEYKLLQYDKVNEGRYYDTRQSKGFMKRFDSLLTPGIDAVVLCDNRHGTFDRYVAEAILRTCREKRVLSYVDSQVSQSNSNHEWYRGADHIFLNQKEAEILGGDPKRIATWFDSDVIFKRGACGAALYNSDGELDSISKGLVVKTVDTCGAGDALLAAFVARGDLEFANKWAALSTTYKGTIVPKMDDFKRMKT